MTFLSPVQFLLANVFFLLAVTVLCGLLWLWIPFDGRIKVRLKVHTPQMHHFGWAARSAPGMLLASAFGVLAAWVTRAVAPTMSTVLLVASWMMATFSAIGWVAYHQSGVAEDHARRTLREPLAPKAAKARLLEWSAFLGGFVMIGFLGLFWALGGPQLPRELLWQLLAGAAACILLGAIRLFAPIRRRLGLD